MSRPTLFLPCALALLVSCGGGGGTTSGTTRQVTVDDNGGTLTYTTSSDFTPALLPTTNLSVPEQQIFAALNAERARGGSCVDPGGKVVNNPPTTPLVLEKHIYAAARAHAAAMVQYDFSGHLNPVDASNRSPAQRMVNAGYKPLAPLQKSGKALFFEESLAYGYATAEEVIHAWKTESFSHCMTIYVPLTYGAVAVQDGPATNKYPRYWVLNLSGEMAN